MDKISFAEFKKIKIQIGTILKAEEIEGSKKLLKLTVDFGEENPRTILSGIAEFFNPDDLKGKQMPFVVNLEPKKIMGIESNGMILAGDVKGKPVLLLPQDSVPAGTEVI